MNTLIAGIFVVFAVVALTACQPARRQEPTTDKHTVIYQTDKRAQKVLRELKECWKPEVKNPDQCVIAKGIAI